MMSEDKLSRQNGNELVAKHRAMDFGKDSIAVAIIAELLRQTTADIKRGRGKFARMTSLQKTFALDDAETEALQMVRGLLGNCASPAIENRPMVETMLTNVA